MTFDQIFDRLEAAVDIAFQDKDTKKEDVIAALESLVNQIKEGFFDDDD